MLHDPNHAFMPYPAVAVARASTGPLAGLSFAVKDLFDVAGYPTSGGSPFILAMSGVKTHTAPTVQRLLDAGAHFVGKAVSDEFAHLMSGMNAHFGSPVNGAAPQRICGGSSSGSASAVSNHQCDFALGTDTGGSVRAPASHCGLYGLRPTHGRVSLAGAMDLSPSLDTCGWFARDARTFARVGDVLLGADAAAALQGVPLLWPEELWDQLAAPARAAAEQAAQAVQKVLGAARPVKAVLDSLDTMYWSLRYLQGREAWNTHGPLIERYAPPLGPGVAERFEWSQKVTDGQVAQATVFRVAFRAHMERLLAGGAILLLPTMPDIAPLRADALDTLEDYRNRAIRLLCVAGLAGSPQLSLPLIWRDGSPMGLSLLGAPGSDAHLIALAVRLAEAGVGA